jgi:hypothetical protein
LRRWRGGSHRRSGLLLGLLLLSQRLLQLYDATLHVGAVRRFGHQAQVRLVEVEPLLGIAAQAVGLRDVEEQAVRVGDRVGLLELDDRGLELAQVVVRDALLVVVAGFLLLGLGGGIGLFLLRQDLGREGPQDDAYQTSQRSQAIGESHS